MKSSKTLIIAIVITTVLAGGGGFFGGMKYGQSLKPGLGNGQFSAFRNGNGNIPGAAAANRLRGGNGFVNGEILSKDDKSITVKNRDGGSQIVFFGSSTTIGKTTSGTADDLTAGQNIIANGTANSDGTITANNISISSSNSPLPGHPYGDDAFPMPTNGGNTPPPANGGPNTQY